MAPERYGTNAPVSKGRPLRADARRNRERVLAAAAELFAEAGQGVPLDDIAARAGVGPGTVYRHFPTKEALFAAVTDGRLAAVVEDARARASAADPAAALDGFLVRIAADAATKRDVPDAMAGPSAGRIADLHEAVDVLLDRARAVGAVRPGITAPELMSLLKAVVEVGRGDGAAIERLVAVVRDGLRPRGVVHSTDVGPPTTT
jgi:AcrR family transcriptional regulator